jgi:hypothetical protein
MKERIDEKNILKYLPGLSRDICERSGISRQHTNICLKRLLDQNLIEIEKIVKVRGTPAPYYRLKKMSVPTSFSRFSVPERNGVLPN